MQSDARWSEISLDELVRIYSDAAVAHGHATQEGDSEVANLSAGTIADVYRELRRRGTSAQSALLPLLDSDETSIRMWVAAHSLEFAPLVGEPILVAMCSEPGAIGLTASTTLREWQAGRLRFP
jgi:hypothetical protein